MNVAFITGAASGIGLATARLFMSHGWHVAAADVDEAALRAAFGCDDRATPIICDITRPGAVDDAIAAAAAMGELQVVVANAGVHARNTVLNITDEALDRLLDVNVRGTVRTVRAAARVFAAAGRGSIVVTASDQAFIGKPGNFGYGLTKGAIAQLTRTAALELAPAGVRVNAVCPGTVDTPFVHRIFADAHSAGGGEIEAMWAEERSLFPLGRTCRPEEVAEAIFFLATQATFSTGALFKIDGGLTAG
ncbi:MAG: SDR family oxidoreductase [Muribaculaceae bacterium]|nr:SDR family oxidoreductase [Muribaculaceae bacterium]